MNDSHDIGTSRLTLVKRYVVCQRNLTDEAYGQEWLREQVRRETVLRVHRSIFANPLHSVSVEIPASWWQALKVAAKNRWPRMLGWLSPRVSMLTVSVDDFYPDAFQTIPGLGESRRMIDWMVR